MTGSRKRTRRGYPIRLALNSLLLASIAATAVGIGVSAYLNARSTVELLWKDLSSQIADAAVEKTLRYLETGPTSLASNRFLYEASWLDVDQPRALLEFLLTGLRSHPNVTWYSFGRVDGTYLSAYRMPDGEIRLTWREVVDETRTHHRDFAVREDGGWDVVRDDHDSTYDPRRRTWWAAALESDGPTWVEPFLFVTRNQPGFMCVERQEDETGALVGVWAIEYEMSYLSRFLAEMRVVDRGHVYLITDQGRVIGHPDGWTTAEVDGEPQIALADGHRDPLLAKAYELARGDSGQPARRFGFEHEGAHYLAVTEPFPSDSAIPWSVAIVVAEHDLFGRIYRNNRMTAIIAGLVALGTFLVGAVIIRSVVGPLNAIAGDLDRIGKLQLAEDRDESPRGTFVREVHSMMMARDRMKGGLRSFAKYVPAELVRDLMASGQEASLGVEMRELTVFFSDIVEFTAIAERLDPDVLSALLGEYLEAMSTAISAGGGTVDKYIGDAIMAFWGAPRPLDNHAISACRAALVYQERLAVLCERWTEQGLPAFRARIGINTGTALVGNVGSERRMNYTVIGDTVNLASRIEGLCGLYGLDIALGSRTVETAGEAVLVCPIDRVAVKGRVAGEVIYELLAMRDDATEPQRELAEAVTQAFEAYQRRDFAPAASGYQIALELEPEHIAARLMLARCQTLMTDPPGEDWSGIHVLTTKK